ncbi:uncharacterized protein LOC6037675 [Culex quinquefasciatus]|uniref:uncharacterized protein LOC6037675 n=1 Tax=Culex quinquefasciatus TaxID=7176 RepID=UPI0018E2FAA6|nr:uncharacterized protein LOC6037675 [Culex quinquefasciatus]
MEKRAVVQVLVVVIVGVLSWVEARQYGLVCRVKDPSVVSGCNVFKDCLYELYPVEVAQNSMDIFGGHNRLFSLYGGPSSCGYFGKLIATPKGQLTLIETIKKQLLKSGFRGFEIQCDAVMAEVSQSIYASFLDLLRTQLGGGYIIAVSLKHIQLEQCLVNTLNSAVDLVIMPMDCTRDCNIQQLTNVQNAIAHGLDRQKIVLEVVVPSVLRCPLNTGASNLFTFIQKAGHEVLVQDLFGASLQLDRDDVMNVCGSGRFPLLRLLNFQLNGGRMMGNGMGSGGGSGSCSFSGFVRDTRDCSRFYSCNNGQQNQMQCPLGKSFDLCSSSCQPFYQVNCNQTSCTLTGVIDGGGNKVPIPIPYPFPFPGACGGNGMDGTGTPGANGTNTNINATTVTMLNQQTSELLKLLNATDLEQTVGILNKALKDVYPPLKDVVGNVNDLLSNLLLGNQAMNDTMGQMDEMRRKLGLLESLLDVVLNLLKNLLGLDLTGLLGGGGGGGAAADPLAPVTGLLGGATGGAPAGGGPLGGLLG